MAGVYVSGVKKPYGCTFCPWCQTTYSFCKAANKNISVLEMNKGPDWCPLMEVPDHGDLIDKSVLYDHIKEGYDIDFQEDQTLLNAILEIVDYQEAVIPAERREDV